MPGPTISINGVATVNSNTSAGQRYEEDPHDLGPFNSSSRAIVERTDELIGQMIAALPAGYDLVVTADHGFERVDHMANLDVLLEEHAVKGQVHSLGGIATTNDPAVAAFLRGDSEAGKCGIGRVIPALELQRYAPDLADSLLAVEPVEHSMFGFGPRATIDPQYLASQP